MSKILPRQQREIDAPVVVNVAGPHSFIINRMAGVEDGMNVKTAPLGPKSTTFQPRLTSISKPTGCHTSDGDTGIYFRPDTGNHLLIGSRGPRMRSAGVGRGDQTVMTATSQLLVGARGCCRWARRIPSLLIPNERQGCRGPLRRLRRLDPNLRLLGPPRGFYMAVGTSGNQFKNGAGPVGYLMAELIDQVEHGHDHDRDLVQGEGPIYRHRARHQASTSAAARSIAESSFSVNG